VAGGINFTAVATGGSGTSCGLSAGNDIYCWGGIIFSNPETPVLLAGSRKFTSVTVGHWFACGIELGTTQAFCWGRLNNAGQQGNGTFTPSNLTPVAVSGGHSFVELAAGDAHVCGVTTTGQVYCWGDRRGGAIGDGVTNVSFVPQPVLVPGISAIAVRAGFNSSCALSAGGLVSCWGDDTQGTLGVNPADRFSNVPVIVP
jgi:alpha-tubulin suppressor-like RCC1 family protein